MSRRFPASRKVSASRKLTASRKDRASRKVSASEQRQVIKCPVCASILFYVEEMESNDIKCQKCGNIFRI